MAEKSLFPEPSGPYPVGCIDICTGTSPIVRIYYPTEDSLSSNPGDFSHAKWSPHPNYMTSCWRLGVLKIPVNVSQSAVFKSVNGVVMPALYGAPLQREEGVGRKQYPVILFSHGRLSMRTRYSAFSCDAASHGYIVAVPEHRDGSACIALNCRRQDKSDPSTMTYEDEWIPYDTGKEEESDYELRTRQIKERIKELDTTRSLVISLGRGDPVQNLITESSFDLLQFKDCVCEDEIALVGHSFGGATLLQAFYDGAGPFKCGIAMDPWMIPLPEELFRDGIKQPLLFINSALYYQRPETVGRILKLVRPPDEKTGISSSQLITIDGTVHISQSDTIFVLGEYQFDNNKPLVSPDVSFKANMSLCHAFLKRYLLNMPEYQNKVPLLDGEDETGEHKCIIYGTNIIIEV